MLCVCFSDATTVYDCICAIFNGKWKSRNTRVWLVQLAKSIHFSNSFFFTFIVSERNITRMRSERDENIARCERCESGSTTFFNGPTAISNGFIVSSVSFGVHKHNRTPHARYYLISSFRFGFTFSKQIPSFVWLFRFVRFWAVHNQTPLSINTRTYSVKLRNINKRKIKTQRTVTKELILKNLFVYFSWCFAIVDTLKLVFLLSLRCGLCVFKNVCFAGKL